jgi:5-methyltetrahydrofolate--homocysteine methyltransferase
MESTVRELRNTFGGIDIIVGGAPVTGEFAERIGADLYAPDPQAAVRFLADRAV